MWYRYAKLLIHALFITIYNSLLSLVDRSFVRIKYSLCPIRVWLDSFCMVFVVKVFIVSLLNASQTNSRQRRPDNTMNCPVEIGHHCGINGVNYWVKIITNQCKFQGQQNQAMPRERILNHHDSSTSLQNAVDNWGL